MTTVERFECPDCGRSVTRTPSGVEVGHRRGAGDTGGRPRCPRRPESVDPGSIHEPLVPGGGAA